MISRDRLLISLLLIAILLTFTTLALVVDSGINDPLVADAKILGETTPVYDVDQANQGIVEVETVYTSLDICYKESCYSVSSETVEGFYNEQELDVSKVYMYILEYIIPYCEEISGGRELVKNSKGSFYTWKEDYIVDYGNIYRDIVKLLESRDKFDLEIQYNLHKKDLPGTDGKYAERYIEVDNSKQKLYAWENGTVNKEIKLSAAKEGFIVYGVFPIIDKGIVPMAPGGKYMPYWMAFYYSPRQKSWYGLHGLVWWYDEEGNKVYENTEYIGVRRSAGCIRMLKDDAKYLYDTYEKGDLVLIHE